MYVKQNTNINNPNELEHLYELFTIFGHLLEKRIRRREPSSELKWEIVRDDRDVWIKGNIVDDHKDLFGLSGRPFKITSQNLESIIFSSFTNDSSGSLRFVDLSSRDKIIASGRIMFENALSVEDELSMQRDFLIKEKVMAPFHKSILWLIPQNKRYSLRGFFNVESHDGFSYCNDGKKGGFTKPNLQRLIGIERYTDEFLPKGISWKNVTKKYILEIYGKIALKRELHALK